MPSVDYPNFSARRARGRPGGSTTGTGGLGLANRRRRVSLESV